MSCQAIDKKDKITENSQSARAESIAYTLNHALACTFTDFIDPYFGNLTQRFIGRRVSIGCGHDHSKDTHHHHNHHHHHDHHHGHEHRHHHQAEAKWWQWVAGEFIGDFGAVPVTLAFERGMPKLMDNIRNVMEPVLGGYFRNGANRAAKKWAQSQGIAGDSSECQARAEEIYQHEVKHLPQALIWTASSISINLLAQKKLLGNPGPLWQLAVGKAVGASVSASLVVGARGMAPESARNWDRFTSKHLFLPATKAIGPLFGVDSDAVDRMAAREMPPEETAWAERVQEKPVRYACK